ncbi:MAG: hypothetical protein ACKPKO_00915, partial [Candidatus Fonsibacter sp.]
CQTGETMLDVMKFVPTSWIFLYAFKSFGDLVLINFIAAVFIANAIAASRDHVQKQTGGARAAKAQ